VHVVVEIRTMTPRDWPEVAAIFEEGIATRLATFDLAAPTWEEFDTHRHAEHRYVAVRGGAVIGWAALSPTSSRACYAGVAESSVYVADAARGQGVGRALMTTLLERADRSGIWTIEAAMLPENLASVGLHERLGFRLVGRRERIAQLDGVWRDTLLLERRVP
jgi:L-amino acid N-acyltransferase YncA